MSINETIAGLKYTVMMCAIDPETGNDIPRHHLDASSLVMINACEDAIQRLENMRSKDYEDAIQNIFES